MEEEEPLLTGSINQGSGDYGSHDNGEHYHHEESPGSRRLSYSVTDDSFPVHEGTYVLSAWPECPGIAFTTFPLTTFPQLCSAVLLYILFLCVLFNKSLKVVRVVSLWGWYHIHSPLFGFCLCCQTNTPLSSYCLCRSSTLTSYVALLHDVSNYK